MRTRIIVMFLLFVASAFGAVPAWGLPAGQAGEAPSPETVTLDDALQTALRAYPTMIRSSARVDEADALRDRAVSDFLPRVEIQGRVSRISDAARIEIAPGSFGITPIGPIPPSRLELDAGDRDNVGVRVSVIQPIYTGGYLTGKLREAEAARRVADFERQIEKEDLVFRVEQAYIAVLRAEADFQIAGRETDDIEAHLKKVRDRYDAGAVPRNDVLKTEARRAHARQVRTSAANRVSLSKTDLNLFLRRDARAEIQIAEPADAWSPPESFEEAVRTALDRRPEMRSANQRTAMAEAGRAVSRSDYFPKVSAAGVVDRQKETIAVRPETWELVGTATWTVWEWGKTKNAVRAAARRIDASQADALLAEDGVVHDVREALLALEEAAENGSAAEAGLRHADENARVTSDRFDVGLATSTDVLDAETLLTQARLDRTKAGYDLLAAKSLCRRAMGVSLDYRIPLTRD